MNINNVPFLWFGNSRPQSPFVCVHCESHLVSDIRGQGINKPQNQATKSQRWYIILHKISLLSRVSNILCDGTQDKDSVVTPLSPEHLSIYRSSYWNSFLKMKWNASSCLKSILFLVKAFCIYHLLQLTTPLPPHTYLTTSKSRHLEFTVQRKTEVAYSALLNWF